MIEDWIYKWNIKYILKIGLSDHFDKNQLLHDKVGTSYYGISDDRRIWLRYFDEKMIERDLIEKKINERWEDEISK